MIRRRRVKAGEERPAAVNTAPWFTSQHFAILTSSPAMAGGSMMLPPVVVTVVK
jgi:hypothetical protein